MSNQISNQQVDDSLTLSNGATDVPLSVLLLAGSDLAETTWEKELVIWLAEHDQSLLSLGAVGFDLEEIAWKRKDFDDQKRFFLRSINLATQRHRWEAPSYDPQFALEHLAKLRQIVESFTPEMVNVDRDWDWLQSPESLKKCAQHQVYIHTNGCLLCYGAAMNEVGDSRHD